MTKLYAPIFARQSFESPFPFQVFPEHSPYPKREKKKFLWCSKCIALVTIAHLHIDKCAINTRGGADSEVDNPRGL